MDAVTLALIKSMANGGGGGSSLPSVTSADNGKVLTVEDGAWAAGFRTQVDPVNIQHIPVTFDGSSFTTTITPKDVEDGFTYDGVAQPSFSQSQLSVIDFYVGGEVVSNLNLTIYENNSDGPTFRSYIFDLEDGLGLANEYGYFSLDSAGNDNPYLVSLVSWAKSGKFIVTCTPSDETFTFGQMDKTAGEIKQAVDAGMEVWFQIPLNVNLTGLYACNGIDHYPNSPFGYAFVAMFVLSFGDYFLVRLTTDASSEDSTTWYSNIFPLTPAS